MEVKEFYTGYLKFNGTKEFLKKIDNEYKLFVTSDSHMYIKYITQKAYDENGVFISEFTKKENYTKKETKQINKQLQLVQINYDFKLLPIGRCWTVDEVYDCKRILKSSFNIKDPSYTVSYRIYDCMEAYNDTIINKPIENFIPFEICKFGYSREINNITNKKLFDLDIKKYTKMKDDFIKQNPEWTNKANHLYKINIGNLCLFWDVTKKQLLKDKFCKKSASIKKLNRKITSKLK